MGTEPLRSGQHRGQATRRAAAKANGLIAEIGSPHEADSSGAIGDAKSFFPLLDGQCRRGRMGQMPASDLPADVEGGNPGEPSSESSEGLDSRQEDP